ncbi:MAG: metal-dependent hydrolase [Nanoarchaeota archaeon]
MMWKTHLAIGLAAALFFSTRVTKPIIFIPVVLIASLFPDIDSGVSYLGKKIIFRPIQLGVEHRGVVHSYTISILLSILIAFFYPVLALPFFIGYSFHLFADSFTVQGIRPFWPLKGISKGLMTTGGTVEKTVFYTFIIIDLVFLGTVFYTLF